MEVKKKFEKPQMEVLKLKPADIMSGSCTVYDECSYYNSCSWDTGCFDDGCPADLDLE